MNIKVLQRLPVGMIGSNWKKGHKPCFTLTVTCKKYKATPRHSSWFSLGRQKLQFRTIFGWTRVIAESLSICLCWRWGLTFHLCRRISVKSVQNFLLKNNSFLWIFKIYLLLFVLLLLLLKDDDKEKNGDDCKWEIHMKYAEITPLFGSIKKYRVFAQL